MILQAVPSNFVHQTWPKIEKWMTLAGSFSGEYTLDQLKQDVFQGRKLLVVVKDGDEYIGALAISFQNRPLHRVAHVNFIGGRLIITEDGLAQLKKICVERGATYLEGSGRDSICRLYRGLGFEKKYTVFGMSL